MTTWDNFGHAENMKITISICDDISKAAERTAESLGISQSELYARAIAEFVSRCYGERVTERLDAVYGDDKSLSALDKGLAALQFHALSTKDKQ